MPDAPLLRSYLYAPGSSERILAKVMDSGADAVVLDLEDSVAASQKDLARERITAFIAEHGSIAARDGRPELHVRVNHGRFGFDTDDVRAAVASGVSAIRLPKAEDPRAIRLLDGILGNLERERGLAPHSIKLYALVESALGLHNAHELAAAPRVIRLCFGAADFVADIGARPSGHGHATLFARSQLVLASRVAGIAAPVDSVHTSLDDDEGLRTSASVARDLGFSGKSVIHPRQLAVVHDVFTPTDDEVTWAKSVLQAFEDAQARGEAALALEGEFIDPAVVARARALLSHVRHVDGPGGEVAP